MGMIIALVIGLLIGWGTPQPAWADKTSTWIKNKWAAMTTRQF